MTSSRNTGPLVVGFHSTHESIGALRWAIEKCRAEQRRLVVVHASSVPIAVDNGPSASIAHQLGNPAWATVHSVVTGLDAPPDTVTRVRSGEIVELIAAEAQDAAMVVLGPRRRRIFRRHDTQYQLLDLVDCPVIRIDDRVANDAPLELTVDEPELAVA